MNRLRLAAFALTVVAFTTVALIGQGEPKTSAGKMQLAAGKFVASLSPELKKKAAVRVQRRPAA